MRGRALALAGTALLTVMHWSLPAGAQSVEQGAPQSIDTPAAPIVPVLTEQDRALLLAAVRSPGRIDPARDRWRNPVATLQFFGIKPNHTVIEVWPGQGWYSSILAPYLTSGGGQLIAGHFDRSVSASPAVVRMVDTFESRFAQPSQSVIVRGFGPGSTAMAPPNSVDAVLTFRNVHNWMAQGWAEEAFANFYTALKPGGILGIEEHRLDISEPQDPLAATGYVREDFIIALAEEAGFEFVGRSEVNANPADTRDHPFGVWTLPPVRRSSPFGMPDDPDFDHRPYDQIGESDRMTLRFRKPLTPPPPAVPPVQQATRGAPTPVPVTFGPSPQASPRATQASPPPPPVAASSTVSVPTAVEAPPQSAPPAPSGPAQPVQPVQPIRALPPAPVSPGPAAAGTTQWQPVPPSSSSGPDWRPVAGYPPPVVSPPAVAVPVDRSPPPAVAPPPPQAAPPAARRPAPPPPAARRPAPPPPATRRPAPPPPAARRPAPPPPAARRPAPPPPVARRPAPPPPAARRPSPPPPPARPRDPNKPDWVRPKN